MSFVIPLEKFLNSSLLTFVTFKVAEVVPQNNDFDSSKSGNSCRYDIKDESYTHLKKES